MRRLAAALALLLCAALAPAAAASAGRRVAGVPLASATLDECLSAPDAASRYATFTGQMAAVPQTAEMAMRFDLLARAPHERWRRVAAPGLGRWERSAAGVDVFRYHKQVTNLGSPVRYRARLRFRWLDGRGDVIRRARRRTAICREPDQRPDLRVAGVTATPAGSAGLARYEVTVANTGRGDAGPFQVALRLGRGRPAHTVAVVGLDHRATGAVELVAAACAPGDRLRVTADSDERIDESDEGDDTLDVRCPLGRS